VFNHWLVKSCRHFVVVEFKEPFRVSKPKTFRKFRWATHKNNSDTFHYTGWLSGILIMFFFTLEHTIPTQLGSFSSNKNPSTTTIGDPSSFIAQVGWWCHLSWHLHSSDLAPQDELRELGVCFPGKSHIPRIHLRHLFKMMFLFPFGGICWFAEGYLKVFFLVWGIYRANLTLWLSIRHDTPVTEASSWA